MAKRRSPSTARGPAFRGLDPVPARALSVAVEDYTTAARQDGPAVSASRGACGEPTPRLPQHRLGMSVMEVLETLVCLGPLWDLGTEIEELLVSGCGRRVGRPREYRAAEAVIFSVAVWCFGSHAAAHDNLADPLNWSRLQAAVERAWPGRGDRRLSPTPISRFQHRRFRQIVSDRDGGRMLDEITKRVNERCVEAAQRMGMLAPGLQDSLARPDKSRIVTGDGTWLRAAYDSQTGTHPSTGRRVRHDLDARPFHTSDGARCETPGHLAAAVSARNPHPGERVVLATTVVPGGTTDATAATDMALDLIQHNPDTRGGMRAFAYDMALRSIDIDRLLDCGVIAVVKTPLTSTGRYSQANLGPHTFTTPTGAHAELTVHALDGVASQIGCNSGWGAGSGGHVRRRV